MHCRGREEEEMPIYILSRVEDAGWGRAWFGVLHSTVAVGIS